MSTIYTIYPSSPTALITGATATGAGIAFANALVPGGAGVLTNFAWQTVVTGSPGGISVTLEGSLDGTNWETLDTSTNTGGEVRGVTGKPATFLRANVGTLTGGTNPTVGVTIQPGQ